jgi:hypothetical protein
MREHTRLLGDGKRFEIFLGRSPLGVPGPGAPPVDGRSEDPSRLRLGKLLIC